jgi:nucleoside-diphosphate-sugar epimerase
LFEWLGRGIAPILGADNARFSLIYVDDLAAAAAAWLEIGDRGRRTYEVHDGRTGGYGWTDVIAIAQRLTGRRVRRARIPGELLRVMGWSNRRLAQGFGYAPMLTPGKVRELRHPDWVCDNTAFTGATGWQPCFSLAQALPQTMGWDTA